MGYVAIKGGEQAIEAAEAAIEFLRTRGAVGGESPLATEQLKHQLHFLHSQLLSEGGLYDPELAGLAIKQCLGDPLEAAFLLRAYRCTRPRLLETPALDTSRMRLVRRISAAFKDIPGGHALGPTPDYTHRLFRFELLDESQAEFEESWRNWKRSVAGLDLDEIPNSVPKVIKYLRDEGLLMQPLKRESTAFDITRQPIVFPLPRSGRLAMMSRAQSGSILAMAYSSMRGYGDVHPTVAELRVGYLPVQVPHPVTGDLVEAGEVLMTECEVVTRFYANQDSLPVFGLGYGACFGHNESKAISMAILDRSLQHGEEFGVSHPSEDPEFVLMHIDGVESMGFCVHYKMPHYVTFQSDLDRLRASQAAAKSANVAHQNASVGGAPQP